MDEYTRLLCFVQIEQAHALEQVDLANARKDNARARRDACGERVEAFVSAAHMDWFGRLKSIEKKLFREPAVKPRRIRKTREDDA